MCCFNFWCVLCNSCTYFISIICFSDRIFTCCQSFVSFFHLSFFSSFVKGIITIYFSNCLIINFLKFSFSIVFNSVNITIGVDVTNFRNHRTFFIKHFSRCDTVNRFQYFSSFFLNFSFCDFLFRSCHRLIVRNLI
ncbi:Uncharacterised protein [Streptococcus pyogenes]|nr:Uncharacterised protein [Streptococcus pyogenes]VHB47547.1 Uncharacterised protein [Streptococcus pyogenes]VHB49563.1 Uncharacterised protein [Streptococcus pyogenes]VHB59679.1 Uncharacterised protein [Streptococcus pyogenes]